MDHVARIRDEIEELDDTELRLLVEGIHRGWSYQKKKEFVYLLQEKITCGMCTSTGYKKMCQHCHNYYCDYHDYRFMHIKGAQRHIQMVYCEKCINDDILKCAKCFYYTNDTIFFLEPCKKHSIKKDKVESLLV
jgi:hypothetical protein